MDKKPVQVKMYTGYGEEFEKTIAEIKSPVLYPEIDNNRALHEIELEVKISELIANPTNIVSNHVLVLNCLRIAAKQNLIKLEIFHVIPKTIEHIPIDQNGDIDLWPEGFFEGVDKTLYKLVGF